MIILKNINNSEITVNCELIETIKSTPDTIITLTNGRNIIVKNSVDDIIEKTIEYKRKIFYNSI